MGTGALGSLAGGGARKLRGFKSEGEGGGVEPVATTQTPKNTNMSRGTAAHLRRLEAKGSQGNYNL